MGVTMIAVAAPVESREARRRLLLAGEAHITLRSQRTGQRFTYRIRRPKATSPHFVAVLRGPGNDSDASYAFLGSIFDRSIFRHGTKSRIGRDAPSARAFNWAAQRILNMEPTPEMEFWHEGRCCRCGRLLTDPESITRGLGPICAGESPDPDIIPFSREREKDMATINQAQGVDRDKLLGIARARRFRGLVREIREMAGLTQSEVARQLGVSRQAVNQWELGRTGPSGDLAVR